MGPRADLDERKLSSPPGFDPGPSSLQSVTIPTELPGPHSQSLIWSENIDIIILESIESIKIAVTPKVLMGKLRSKPRLNNTK